MNLEIHKPELVQRVNAHIQTGHFHDADELIEKALDALDEQATAAAPATETGAVVLAALQARPYPDIDLTPPARAPHQCAGCRALMAWLLDTNILSEGRKPRPEPRVTAFYDAQPLNRSISASSILPKFASASSFRKTRRAAPS